MSMILTEFLNHLISILEKPTDEFRKNPLFLELYNECLEVIEPALDLCKHLDKYLEKFRDVKRLSYEVVLSFKQYEKTPEDVKHLEKTLNSLRSCKECLDDDVFAIDLARKWRNWRDDLEKIHTNAKKMIASSNSIKSRVSYSLSRYLNPEKYNALKEEKEIMNLIKRKLKKAMWHATNSAIVVKKAQRLVESMEEEVKKVLKYYKLC